MYLVTVVYRNLDRNVEEGLRERAEFYDGFLDSKRFNPRRDLRSFIFEFGDKTSASEFAKDVVADTTLKEGLDTQPTVSTVPLKSEGTIDDFDF